MHALPTEAQLERNVQLVDQLLPLASELIVTVRDHGPETTASVLARVPDGRHDALAVVLAAMVDPGRSILDLLGWVQRMPQSLDGSPRRYSQRIA